MEEKQNRKQKVFGACVIWSSRVTLAKLRLVSVIFLLVINRQSSSTSSQSLFPHRGQL